MSRYASSLWRLWRLRPRIPSSRLRPAHLVSEAPVRSSRLGGSGGRPSTGAHALPPCGITLGVGSVGPAEGHDRAEGHDGGGGAGRWRRGKACYRYARFWVGISHKRATTTRATPVGISPKNNTNFIPQLLLVKRACKRIASGRSQTGHTDDLGEREYRRAIHWLPFNWRGKQALLGGAHIMGVLDENKDGASRRLVVMCAGMALFAGVPAADATTTAVKCAAITGSGSSLQTLAQTTVWTPTWSASGFEKGIKEQRCENSVAITYTATSSGKGLAEWGSKEGVLKLGEAGNGKKNSTRSSAPTSGRKAPPRPARSATWTKPARTAAKTTA